MEKDTVCVEFSHEWRKSPCRPVRVPGLPSSIGAKGSPLYDSRTHGKANYWTQVSFHLPLYALRTGDVGESNKLLQVEIIQHESDVDSTS